MDEKHISRLVGTKAAKHLRSAAVLVTGALLLLSGLLIVAQAQHLQAARDFRDNPSIHLVKVSSGVPDRVLTSKDVEAIVSTVADDVSAHATRYELGFGISDRTDRTWFVVGLGGDASAKLGFPELADDVAYHAGTESGTLTLAVPVVTVDEGGMSSDRRVDRDLSLRGGVPTNAPLFIFDHFGADTRFVNESTFRDIASTSTGVAWEDILRDPQDGIDPLRDAHLWVDDLDRLVPTAERLDQAGWATSFTARAFDDLAGSLDRTAMIGAVAIFQVTGLGIAVALTSVRSYLRLSRRDMGVLRHLGHPAASVRRIYGRRIATTIAGSLVCALVVTLVAGAVLLLDDPVMILADAVALLVLAALIMAIAWFQLRRVARTPVLELLTLNREFE